MEVIEGHRALDRSFPAPAVALGNFDGFHIGHQELVSGTVQIAQKNRGTAWVYTFDPHPAKVLAPHLAPKLITTRERKLELLAQSGVDVCILEPFNSAIASLSPQAFFEDILVKTIGARHIRVGYDFTFGHKRAGTTKTLLELAEPHKIQVEVLEPVAVDGLVASSTRIRNFVGSGNLAGAQLLLGRPFEVDGTVIHGAARGRVLGFPTANIATTTELLPPIGIYAVRMEVQGQEKVFSGAASLGTNPTFGGGALILEVHVLDFSGDLYDRLVRVEFIERIRGEECFDSEQALIKQMQIDVSQARQILELKKDV